MPITIGSNIASLRAQRQLGTTSKGLESVFERLGSGMRINRASDDAAGLAISTQLNSNRRVFNQGVRNFNDGLSLLSIADSTLEQLSNITVRLQELATQSANGILGPQQRKSLDSEAQALSKEFTRIVQSTKFNQLSMLNGSMGDIRLQGGYGTEGSIVSGVGGAIGTGRFNLADRQLWPNDYDTLNSTAMGDINGDGILDLAVSGAFDADGLTNILIGRGDGTFSQMASYIELNGNNSTIKFADLNNDGILDLVGGGTHDKGGSVDGYAIIRLGNGDGSFGDATSFRMNLGGLREIAIGDLNNDGILDIASVSDSSSKNIGVRLGTGNGSFSGLTTILTPTAEGVLLGDINGDGNLDIITSGTTTALNYKHSVHLGNGTGSFQSGVTYTLGNGDLLLDSVVSDLNGDGMADLLIGGALGGQLMLRLGKENGTFSTATTIAVNTSGIAGILAFTIGDINGDGNTDIVMNAVTSLAETKMITLLGNGSTSFQQQEARDSQPLFGRGILIGDSNNDGVNDLIVSGYEDLQDSDGYAFHSLINSTRSGTSSILNFSLKTQSDSLQALPIFKKKLEQLASQRGTVGAFQARLKVGISTLESASENYAAAAGRITDADIASESANLVRLQILQQAASSVLAQANTQPALAIKLLNQN